MNNHSLSEASEFCGQVRTVSDREKARLLGPEPARSMNLNPLEAQKRLTEPPYSLLTR